MPRGEKVGLEYLATFGGTPLFKRPLHVNKPWVGDRAHFDKYLDTAWESHWFANDGPLATALEQRLADRLDVANCVLMSNGTSAMSLLLHVLGISGEVILPSFTFVSTAHALMMQGLQPVFCDIDPDSWNMSTRHCQTLISDKTAAIIPTHVFGRPCDIDGFRDISRQAQVPLILDAAHAFDCSFKGRKLGSFGDAEVFSFHATKAFHTGEGGAVTCQDDGLAEKLRLARNFGFVGPDRVNGVGTNAKMSELSAAMGMTNLDALDSAIVKNKAVYQAYAEGLAGVPRVSLVQYDAREKNNYWYIALQISPDFGMARNTVLQILQAENILARRYFFPGCHNMHPYCTMPAGKEAQLPNTGRVAENCLILPGGGSVDPRDVATICALLANIANNASALSELFRNNANTEPANC